MPFQKGHPSYPRTKWKKFGKKEWHICKLVNENVSYTEITQLIGMDRGQSARIYMRWNEEYLKNPKGEGIIEKTKKLYHKNNKTL